MTDHQMRRGALRDWEREPVDLELARQELVGLAREAEAAGNAVGAFKLGELAQGLSNLLVWLDPFRVEWHRERIDHLLQLALIPTDLADRLRYLARADEATKELEEFDAGTDGTLDFRARTSLALGLAEAEACLHDLAREHLTFAANHFRDQEDQSGWSQAEEHSLGLAEMALRRLTRSDAKAKPT